MKKLTSIFFIFAINCNVSAQHFELNKDFVEFKHQAGSSGDFYYPEIVGSGVAVLDFDNDGDQDIYLVQGGKFGNKNSGDRLYQNLLVESGSLKFKDVTKKSGINQDQYGIGVAIADVNNDGWDDVFLAQLHENTLLLNQKGTGFKPSNSFESDEQWSVAASFCDVNNDGLKDLYIANYVEWSKTNNPKCYNSKSKRDYCGPSSFKGIKDQFYIQTIDNGLELASEKFFPQMVGRAGMNVLCRDINSDGYSDFIVANDGEKNLVWLNQNGVSFKEYGLFSGMAVNLEGKPEASMGMATADFDMDGDIDVFFTHLLNETNTLYANSGKGLFQDVSNRSGIAQESKPYTGWATGFLHVNDDVYPDLIAFNGAVADTYEDGEKSSLRQPNQLYLNSKSVKFNLANESSLEISKSSRGAAFVDIDNDGDIDVVVNNNDEKPDLLLNQLNPKKWYGLTVKDKSITNVVYENKESTLTNLVYLINDGSYASANDSRIIINQAQFKEFTKLSLYANSSLIKVIEFDKLAKYNQYNNLEKP